MFQDIVALGTDIDRRGSRHIGSMLVARMTVAGKLRAALPVARRSSPFVDWLRRLKDPLRNTTQIGRWMARLPVGDVLEIQRQALELLANFPSGGRERQRRSSKRC